MKAYKLLRVRKNGTIGPLFINKKLVIPIGVWLHAEPHPTKGYTYRPFWHCTSKPFAPHLTEKERCWYEVEIDDFQKMVRPEHQGGVWYLANKMKIIKKL
jgi:hypothetical protein